MMRSATVLVGLLAIAMTALLVPSTDAFVVPSAATKRASTVSFLAKKPTKEDLSFIESRDMTKEEMLELNKKNEGMSQLIMVLNC